MRVTVQRENEKETYTNWLIYWSNAPWIQSLEIPRLRFTHFACRYYMTKRNKMCNGNAKFEYQSFNGPVVELCGRHLMKWLWSPNEEKRARKHIRLNPPPWTRL